MWRGVRLIGLALFACSRQVAAPHAVPPAMSDPPQIISLDGYRSVVIPEPVFGGQVRLLEVGAPEAPPLLLVHGIGDQGVRDFFPILRQLAATHHLFAVDLPGFGQSTHGTALYSPERYAHFLHQVVAARINKPFILLGHSMGGAIALLYAHQYPELVQRLVLLDVAGILHREALIPLIVQTGLGKLFEPAGNLAGTLTSIFIGHAPGPETVLANDLARSELLPSPSQVAAATLILHNFGPAIAELRVPSLVVWGRHDAIAPLRTGKLLAARLPQTRLAILERSAHVPMQTEPAELVDVIVQWLNQPVPTDAERPQLRGQAGYCNHASNQSFEGDYDAINIVDCHGVRLRNVVARTVNVWDSEVAIEASTIKGGMVALDASRSRLELTGCVLKGRVAARLEASELDAAGSDFTGSRVAVHATQTSRILFSASRISSPKQTRYVHSVLELGSNQAL